MIYNGWGGIRTHGTVTRTPVFKTGALNRSATHPTNEIIGFLIFQQVLLLLRQNLVLALATVPATKNRG